MGTISEDIKNGIFCNECGAWMPEIEEYWGDKNKLNDFLDNPPGYPRTCPDCLTHDARANSTILAMVSVYITRSKGSTVVTHFKPNRIHLSKAQFKAQALEIFEDALSMCSYCGEYTNAPHAHHRVFKSQGGDDAMENITLACWRCHSSDHGKLKGAKTVFEQDYSEINRLEAKYR